MINAATTTLFPIESLRASGAISHALSERAQSVLSSFDAQAVEDALDASAERGTTPHGLATLRGWVRVEVLISDADRQVHSYCFMRDFQVTGCEHPAELPALASAHFRHLMVAEHVIERTDWEVLLVQVARTLDVAPTSLELDTVRCAEIWIDAIELQAGLQ